MTVLSIELKKKARKWVSYAEEDLRLAKQGLKISSSCPYRLIAYHAQQCAEKYLKAYLVLKQVDFPYTHNIRNLLQLCTGDWIVEISDADELTPYAVTTRYPGVDDRVTRKDAAGALELAKRVRKAVRRSLREEGFFPFSHSSPLDVPSIRSDISTSEIVAVVREGRERDKSRGS